MLTQFTDSYVRYLGLIKRTDVLPQDLMKSRSRNIGCYSDRIALKFDRHLGSAAAGVPVKF